MCDVAASCHAKCVTCNCKEQECSLVVKKRSSTIEVLGKTSGPLTATAGLQAGSVYLQGDKTAAAQMRRTVPQHRPLGGMAELGNVQKGVVNKIRVIILQARVDGVNCRRFEMSTKGASAN